MSDPAYRRTPEQSPEQELERNTPLPEEADPTLPEPQPRDAAEWGPTPTPIQQPVPTPKGAKPGAVLIVAAVLLVALVLLLVALLDS